MHDTRVWCCRVKYGGSRGGGKQSDRGEGIGGGQGRSSCGCPITLCPLPIFATIGPPMISVKANQDLSTFLSSHLFFYVLFFYLPCPFGTIFLRSQTLELEAKYSSFTVFLLIGAHSPSCVCMRHAVCTCVHFQAARVCRRVCYVCVCVCVQAALVLFAAIYYALQQA